MAETCTPWRVPVIRTLLRGTADSGSVLHRLDYDLRRRIFESFLLPYWRREAHAASGDLITAAKTGDIHRVMLVLNLTEASVDKSDHSVTLTLTLTPLQREREYWMVLGAVCCVGVDCACGGGR